MAEKIVTDIQADFLSCKICKLPFKHPKALPCLHTFCKGCLTYHVQKNGVKGKDGSWCVFCPLCTQVCDLPRSGVDGLQDNHLLANLLEMVNSKSLQHCDLCREEGETDAATYCCTKCEDFLCDECAKMHKRTRITREHLVINIGSMMDICRGMNGKEEVPKINARLMTKFGRHSDVLHHPHAMCVNKADEVLVSNDNNTISVFTMSGTCKKVLDQSVFYGPEKNSLPNKGIAVTPEGYITVAMRKDLTPQLVHMGVVQSLAGREISILTGRVKRPLDCQPQGIIITPSNHTVITDMGRNCVYVYDAELQLVRQFGKKGGKGRRQFKGPGYVAATPRSDIVISDYGNHCVKVFDIKGKPKLVIGRMGTDPGQFVHPMGVCVDRYGNIFVADRDNHRVQMFDAQGRFLSIIVSWNCKDGNDIRPQDVTMTTYGHLAVLLCGIEGVDVSEIHIYQYGSSRLTGSGASGTSKTSVQGDFNNPSMPHRLPPLPATDRSSKGQKYAAQPDLLATTKSHKLRGKDASDAAALAQLYATATGHNIYPTSSKDHNPSQICTIL